jgi:hypothetical protein
MNKYEEFDERTVGNIKYDALAAIDALEAIVAECDSQYVSSRYLKEKVDKTVRCVEYIKQVVYGGKA